MAGRKEQSTQAQRSESVPCWWHGCGPLLFLPAAAFLLTPATWSRWVFMWLLASSIYVGCKWLTWRCTGRRRLTLGVRPGYLVLWPGMDAATFLRPSTSITRPSATEWVSALSKTLLGAAVFFALARWLPRRISLPQRLGRHDRRSPHAAFRVFPLGKLCLACGRCGCPAADELATGVGQPRRVLGRALEYRFSGSHVSLPLSPAGTTLWAAWSNLCGVPRQRSGP